MNATRAGRHCLAALLVVAAATPAGGAPMDWPEPIRALLRNTEPLKHARGKRLPLYLWPAMNPGVLSDADARVLVKELDARGIGLVCRWDPGDVEKSLAAALPVARAQRSLGLLVNVDATSCLYSLFDGSPETAHVDAQGKPFWDPSFGAPHMGCPFALDGRRAPIRARIERFAEAYRAAGLTPGFVFADWEVDGPIEWNGAWEASRRCTRCREHIADTGNFLAFQKTLRDLRADIQRDIYSAPLRERFPGVLVGNYAVYPNDGFRYWYDYFERYEEGQPAIGEQGARYRHWATEWERAGYTFSMPVVYTWYPTWGWYDFEPGDYRWFYNMLLVATNAARSAPPGLPIVSFVHWHTTAPPEAADPAVRQMGEAAYQELLWHMLLRGVDTFFLWCVPQEQAQEVRLLHPVWAAAQEHGEFLDRGVPISFDVPPKPGTVVSGLRLGERVLVRRTDFAGSVAEVELRVHGRALRVPASPGRCQVLTLAPRER